MLSIHVPDQFQNFDELELTDSWMALGQAATSPNLDRLLAIAPFQATQATVANTFQAGVSGAYRASRYTFSTVVS